MSIRRPRLCRRACGLSLIELLVFIVVVSIAVVGVLLILNTTVAKSGDPAVRKQMVAIAESLLEEVELMPFTYCDPDDPNVLTATPPSPYGCANPIEGTTNPTPTTETRGSPSNPFDNVWDYNTFNMTGIKDLTGTSTITGLGSYTAAVSVAAVTLSGISAASGDAVLITVTVTSPHGDSIKLDGYRTRYAPNSP
jgi:MSHA pilin protein MshD